MPNLYRKLEVQILYLHRLKLNQRGKRIEVEMVEALS